MSIIIGTRVYGFSPYSVSFADKLKTIHPSNRGFRAVRGAIYDTEAPKGYYYPPKSGSTGSEVPGEVILVKGVVAMEEDLTRSLEGLSENDLKYYNDCIRFIRQQLSIPTEDEIDIVNKVISKNFNDLNVEEEVICEKFKSRFYKNPNDYSEKFYFDEEGITLINPFVEGYEVIMNHYFDLYTSNRVLNIINAFIATDIPNPDMSKETYDVVVAVAHWIRACLIQDYNYLVSETGMDDNYYEYEEDDKTLEEIVERHSGISLEMKYDDDGEERSDTEEPGRYSFGLTTDEIGGHNILANALPPNIELLILETMVRYNKYGFTINASRFFDIDDEQWHSESNLSDNLETTFSDYSKHYLNV